MDNIKQELLKFCWNTVEEKANRLQKRSKELQESLNSETKSSAGDKHETGRAMVQLEQEKLGNQLLELDKLKETLQKVDVNHGSSKIGLGSLVKTTTANYFIAVSTGRYAQNETVVYCVSAAAPIAQLLLGKEQGDSIAFNGKNVEILEVI